MQLPSSSKARSFAAVAGVAIVGLGLAGCSSGNSSGSSSKSITVQVQAGSEKQFQGFIDVFEKENPGVTVKTTSVSQTAKTGSNLQVLTSSDAPDVAIVPTNTQVFSTLTQGKQLLPLDDVWNSAQLDKRYGPSLAPSLKTGGTPYVISYDEVMYDVVYYNTSLLKSAGIALPTDHRIASFDELKSMASKLKAVGKQALAFGPGDNYQASWMIDAYLPTTSSEGQLQNYLTSWQPNTDITAKYTDSAFVDAVAQIQAMGKAGIFQDGALGQKVPQAESLFVQQQAGMLLDGSWTTGVLKKDGVNFDYDWALLPPVQAGKKSQLALYTGDALAIPARAKNPDLAKKFLESVMSVNGQETLIAQGALPSVNDVPDSAYSSLPGQVQEQLADVKQNGGQPGWTSVVPGGLGQQFVDPQVQEMLNGSTTPEAIGDSVQQQLMKTRSGAAK